MLVLKHMMVELGDLLRNKRILFPDGTQVLEFNTQVPSVIRIVWLEPFGGEALASSNEEFPAHLDRATYPKNVVEYPLDTDTEER